MVSKVSPGAQAPNKSSKSGGVFRPAAILAPLLSTSPADYATYVKSYEMYVDACAAFKQRFWAGTHGTGVKLTAALQKATVDVAHDKMGRVLATALRVGEEPVTIAPPKDGYVVNKFAIYPKTELVTAPLPSKGEAVVPKTADPNKKKAKRRRWRANKAARVLKESIKKANALYSLEQANANLVKAAKASGSTVCTTLSRKGKEVQKQTKKEKKAKKSKGKDGGGGGPKGPPPGPPDETPSSRKRKGQDPPKKDPSQPNRKERRRAIYGPPSGAAKPKEVKVVLPVTPLGNKLLAKGRTLGTEDTKNEPALHKGDPGTGVGGDFSAVGVSRLDRMAHAESDFLKKTAMVDIKRGDPPRGMNKAAADALRRREDDRERRSGSRSTTKNSLGLDIL